MKELLRQKNIFAVPQILRSRGIDDVDPVRWRDSLHLYYSDDMLHFQVSEHTDRIYALYLVIIISEYNHNFC